MLTPEQAALEIRAFAKDETGLGNVKSAWAALDVIKKYIEYDADETDKDAIFGALFWQGLNLSWKESFVPMNLVNRYRLRRFMKALRETMEAWQAITNLRGKL